MGQAMKNFFRRNTLLNGIKVKSILSENEGKERRDVITKDGELVLGNDALFLIEGRDDLKKQVKLLEQDIKECENKLKKLLGDYEVGIVANRRVSYKTCERNVLDSKGLKEENPKIYEKYLRLSSFKKLEIK